MSANKDDTLRQFCDVTGADDARSRFFLESSNWQLEVALSSFYEHGGNAEEASVNPAAAPPTAAMPVLSDSDMDSPPTSPLRTKKKEKNRANTNSKFATLNSLQQESSSDEEEARKRKQINSNAYCDEATCSYISRNSRQESVVEDIESLKEEVLRLRRENRELKKQIAALKLLNGVEDKSEEGQAFYAGGSERSGQQILGPGKGRKDIVTEMFKSVRERGAVVFEDEPSTAARGGRGAFSGTGYRLGQTSDDHEPVTPANTQSQSEVRSVRLRLFREGFTVDNGPLRHYTDPDNAEFLSYIRRGETPPELSGGGEVRVSLEDHRHEECPRTLSKTQAFTGKGHLLGSPTPPTVGATAAVAAAVGAVGGAAGGAGSDRAANQRAAQLALHLDENKPTTTVQFRLADGSRLIGRFNHSHTVADLQRYVSLAEPEYQLAQFRLLAGFPSAELTDPSVTLAQAQLLNSTVLQRLK